MRDKCNSPDLCLTASCVGVDSRNRDPDFSRWVVLVKVDHLDVLRFLLAQLDQRVAEGLLE